MTAITTETLINDLRAVTGEFGALLHEESSVIRTANFAHFIGMQDRKIMMHNRMMRVIETIKTAPKSDEQRAEIKSIIKNLTPTLEENKSMLEIGFGAIERLTARVMGVMRRSLQKGAPRYTAGGGYHQNRKQVITMQTDERA